MVQTANGFTLHSAAYHTDSVMGRGTSLQPNNSLELESMQLMKIKFVHRHMFLDLHRC